MTRFAITFSILVGTAALVGCKNPADDVPAATVTTAQPVSNGSAEQAPEPETPASDDVPAAGTAMLTPENTSVTFVGSKVTQTHEGGFSDFSGRITTSEGRVVGGSVELTIQMGSIYADRDRLTQHLRSGDFFDSANHPEAFFRSIVITQGDGPNAFNVAGRLTIKGVSKDVTFPATIVVADGRVKANAEFSINRQEWGINYPGAPDDLIRDEVVIRFNIDAQVQ